MESVKIFLNESEMPRHWYNIQADLPKPMPPVMHPGTHEPIRPEDLAPLFPLGLIAQEMSQADNRGRVMWILRLEETGEMAVMWIL